MSPDPFRILVTGSRDWTNQQWIWEAIALYRKLHGEDVVVVTGACPPRWVHHPNGTSEWVRGADRIAEDAAEYYGLTLERHPAEWELYGRSAGPIRNQMMVNLGADLCLAFIKNASKGATGCAEMAEKARIPVRYWLT